MLLFQDTESTGMLNFKIDLMDVSQPRICSLAAILTDAAGVIIDQMDVLIKPDGWTIEPGAAAVNGLTIEICEAGGIRMVDALARYNEMKARCTIRLGANVSYDKRLLAREAHLCGVAHDSEGMESIDVLQMARPLCMVPNKDGKKGFKLPKLTEAYRALFFADMPNAHSAYGDAEAVMKVYFECLRRMNATA